MYCSDGLYTHHKTITCVAMGLVFIDVVTQGVLLPAIIFSIDDAVYNKYILMSLCTMQCFNLTPLYVDKHL